MVSTSRRGLTMAIFDIFSKRQKVRRGEVSDVYVYDDLPQTLRVQIVHIWRDALGDQDQYLRSSNVQQTYEAIVNALCREYGVFRLSSAREGSYRDYLRELVDSFLQQTDVDYALDFVEMSFGVIDTATRDWTYLDRRNPAETADEAIADLNFRFREHGVGYQYSDGEIIRVDSEFAHVEIVKPALQLLRQKHFSGAQDEFLKAHEHYRHGDFKEALNECLKAFESVMKAICDRRGWRYPPNATAKPLIKVCFDEGLVPAFWQHQYASLQNLLESSIPTGRNKLGGHGQGTNTVGVPSHLVSYMLHMTASAIVFLAEADASMP